MIKARAVNKRTETFDIYIGRGSKWGNPFVIGKDGTRDEVIDKYLDYLCTTDLDRDIHELFGKRLGCFCKPLACHGDILAKAANVEQEWRQTPERNIYTEGG
jgi:hypothetical protein